MHFPHRLQGFSRVNWLLAGLLATTIAVHIGIASIRNPVGPQFGETIHGVTPETTINPGELRVAAYNIRRGKGLDDRRDLDRIKANLQGFDIIGLNEVGGAFWPLADQAEVLGTALGMGWQFTPAQRRWYIDYFGNALLSRLAPDSWQSLPLLYDLNKGTGHRHLQIFAFNWQSTPFQLLVLHAERGDIRDTQIRTAMTEFVRHPHAILMGDFNALPESEIMTSIVSRPDITSVLDEQAAAGHIDWILVRGFRVLEAGILPAGASDHPLIWATLDLATP